MRNATRSAHTRMLELVQAQRTRGPNALGRCPTCGSAVRSAEPHLRLRGEVFHERCARYGGRAPSL
jgi:hypothetical protein